MAITTGRVSLTLLSPRNRFPCLKKPIRVCFGPFPQTSLTIRKIVHPPLAAASSSFNRIFAPRLTKPATTSRATNDDRMILQGEDNKPTSRWFLIVYCCLCFTYLIALVDVPMCLMFHIFMRMFLDATKFFSPSNRYVGLLTSYHQLGLIISCTWFYMSLK